MNKMSDKLIITDDDAAEFVGSLVTLADASEIRQKPELADALMNITNLFDCWHSDENLAVSIGEYIGDVQDLAHGKPAETIEKTRNAVIDYFDGTDGYRNEEFAKKFERTKTNDRWS